MAVLMGLRGRFGQLNMNTQAQSVCVGVDAQLLLVATTSDAQEAVLKLLPLVGHHNNFLYVGGRFFFMSR